MEGVAPPLKLVEALIYRLKSGSGFRDALIWYLENTEDDFQGWISIWFAKYEYGHKEVDLQVFKKLPYRRSLINLLERGLNGAPVLESLGHLKLELERICKLQLEDFMSQLPIKSLVPLLLFIFPSFLIILIGPVLVQLMEALQ